MGEVYRARDTRLGRDVAIKILPAQVSNDPVRKQRFEREAKTISRLNHPHICTLHDIGSQDGVEYLVMECLEGETLAKRLEKGPLPLEQVLKYGAQVADALDKAHCAGIVHRDLKPGNIMLTASGAKLLDFGLAKPAATAVSGMTLTQTTQTTPVTREGTIVGTIQYMSPEQVEGKEVDGRGDIFSLGVMLYEMVTGKKAFEGKNQLSVASAILEKEPAPIITVKPLTPPALDHAIRKCLAKSPDERWQSASDLASELKWIMESGSQAGMPASVVGGHPKREGVAWALAGACTIALLVLGAIYTRQMSTRPPVLVSTVLPPAGARFGFVGPYTGNPQISKDKRTLVFVAVDAQGRHMLWLRALDSPSALTLAGTEGGNLPFWSPDNRSIGFFANGKLKTVEVSGGHVLTLCDAPDEGGGTWNQQGVILFVPDYHSGIYQIPAQGGSPKLVLSVDKSKFTGHLWPNFLPDGNHFTYSAHGGEAYRGVYFASIDGRENKLVLRSTGNAAFASGFLFYPQAAGSRTDLMAVAFDPVAGNVTGKPQAVEQAIESASTGDQPGGDGAIWKSVFAVSDHLMIYKASETAGAAQFTIAWLDRSGKRLSVVASGRNFDLQLSPDGQRMAYSRDGPNGGIWIQELKREVPMRLTFDPSVGDGAPVWSPDGNDILFAIGRGGKTPTGIYRKSSSGTGAEELLLQPKEPGAALWPTDWSRNGQFILCVQGESVSRNIGEIWVLPVSGDRKPRVFVRAPGAAYNGQFSPDGHWVAYVSKESGREEVYVVPFDASQVLSTPSLEQVAIKKKWQVSANGGAFPRWRRDGKELFYVAPGGELTGIGVEAKANEFSVSEARPLFRETLVGVASPYDVSGDGQRFLVNGLERDTLPLTLVANWKELLKNE
jgi:Tol biopolymer transport system component